MPFDDKPQTWGSATKQLRKIAEGGDIGDEAIWGDDPLKPKKRDRDDGSLDYLGHFANDDVAAEGHNVGAKPLGIRRFLGGGGGVAKAGFRTIPGNASTGYVDKKARAVMSAIDSRLGGTVAAGPIDTPVGQPLRTATRIAKAAAGPGVGPMTAPKTPKVDPKVASGMGLPSKRR